MCLLDLPLFLALCLLHHQRGLPTFRSVLCNEFCFLFDLCIYLCLLCFGIFFHACYFQALATELAEHHDTTDLSDIHLLVKRKLAGMKIGDAGVCQGAEERSSLLSKLLFARYRGRRKANIMDGAMSALSFFSLPSSRSSSPMPVKRNILLTNQEKPRPMSAVFS